MLFGVDKVTIFFGVDKAHFEIHHASPCQVRGTQSAKAEPFFATRDSKNGRRQQKPTETTVATPE